LTNVVAFAKGYSVLSFELPTNTKKIRNILSGDKQQYLSASKEQVKMATEWSLKR